MLSDALCAIAFVTSLRAPAGGRTDDVPDLFVDLLPHVRSLPADMRPPPTAPTALAASTVGAAAGAASIADAGAVDDDADSSGDAGGDGADGAPAGAAAPESDDAAGGDGEEEDGANHNGDDGNDAGIDAPMLSRDMSLYAGEADSFDDGTGAIKRFSGVVAVLTRTVAQLDALRRRIIHVTGGRPPLTGHPLTWQMQALIENVVLVTMPVPRGPSESDFADAQQTPATAGAASEKPTSPTASVVADAIPGASLPAVPSPATDHEQTLLPQAARASYQRAVETALAAAAPWIGQVTNGATPAGEPCPW